MTEDEVYMYIEEAIEVFEEAYEEDKSFKSSITYNGCQITASGQKSGEFEIVFDFKEVSTDYQFCDIEELNIDDIYDKIHEELE